MNKFCRFLSNGYSVEQSKIAPCCYYNEKIPFNEDFIEASTHFGEITDWTDSCQVCYDAEMVGEHSFRQASFTIIDEDEIALDLFLDNTCNAACVMCHGDYSSLWQKIDGKPLEDLKIEQKIDRLFDNIDFDKVGYIKFRGGEPLATDTHMRVIERIEDRSNIRLHYVTNGSYMPSQEVLDAWNDFKMIFYVVSVDGINERFNYIRYPLKWSSVSANLLKLREVAPVNLLFRFEYTVNVLNAYYYDEFETWVNENIPTNRVTDPTEINIHPCFGDWAPDNIPPELRKVLIEKNNRIAQLVKVLPEFRGLTAWKEYATMLDNQRNLDWTKVFSEIKEYF